MGTKSPRKSAEEVSIGNRQSDAAYSKVLEALFDGRIPAGSFCSQTELIEITGVALAPLRDALRILEVEGIILIHPRTGIQFIKPGFELTRSTFQYRSIIEAAAVAVYAETAADDEMEDLRLQHETIIGTIEQHGLQPATLQRLEELEHLLHGSIVASLSNPLIETGYRRVRNYIRLIGLDSKLTPPLVLRSMREHLTIVEACQARNPGGAVSALQAHFAAALQRTLKLY